jgi:type IV secretory pathway VirB10-like protein
MSTSNDSTGRQPWGHILLVLVAVVVLTGASQCSTTDGTDPPPSPEPTSSSDEPSSEPTSSPTATIDPVAPPNPPDEPDRPEEPDIPEEEEEEATENDTNGTNGQDSDVQMGIQFGSDCSPVGALGIATDGRPAKCYMGHDGQARWSYDSNRG